MNIDYQARLTKLVNYLQNENVDVAMITTLANVFYYTGYDSDPYERFMALIVDSRSGNSTLFVPSLDEEIANHKSYVKNIVPISDVDNPYKKLKEVLDYDVRSINLEVKAVSMYQHKQLQSIFPNAIYEDIQTFIHNQRLIKSREEVQYTRIAVEIIEQVIEEGLKNFKVGMTELELAAELEYQSRKLGADEMPFIAVLSGENSALPHGKPSNKKIKEREFLLIDTGVVKDGYFSDITRTFVVGEADEKQKHIYDTVLFSNQQAIKAAIAGVPLKSIDIASRKVIEEAGYGEYYIHRVGHGLGIEGHEAPSIHANNNDLVNKGLLFTIEPGIYIPKYGGVRIEDDVYINEDGHAEVITTFSKELQIL